jgi:hypothetical protein
MNELKLLLLSLFFAVITLSGFGQAPYLKDTLGYEEACRAGRIYQITFKLLKHKPASCLVNDAEMLKRLNALAWLRQNPDKKASCSLTLVVNCEGELIDVSFYKNSKFPELDAAIKNLFEKHNKWNAGLLDNKPVDSFVVRKLRIKNGVLTWK